MNYRENNNIDINEFVAKQISENEKIKLRYKTLEQEYNEKIIRLENLINECNSTLEELEKYKTEYKNKINNIKNIEDIIQKSIKLKWYEKLKFRKK